MNATCVYLAPVRTLYAQPYEFNAFLHAEGVGFWSESWIVEDRMTPEDRAAYQQELALEAMMDEGNPGVEMYPEIPVFSCLEDAIKHAELHDDMVSLWQDIRAFGAPGECATEPCRRLDSEIAQVENRATGFVPAAYFTQH